MKEKIQTSVTLAILLSLFSFTITAKIDITGTYGVSENDSLNIELTLNSDNTFTYKDFSNSVKLIDTKGNWELKNKKVILKNFKSEYSFHTKWKISKEGKVAKSRKGITFYTLMKK